MKSTPTYLHKFLLIFTLLFSLSVFSQKKFVIVLDPGHGGKDNGATSYYSDLGELMEKNITLAVTLQLGRMLEKNKDFRVIYTRKTDEFPSLSDRTDLANASKADLFISIHCNSAGNSSANGTETFVQGPNQNSKNLEVAKKENEVIFLDDKDKERFASYNPNSPETLIALKLQQNKYLEKSLMLGSMIEENFVNDAKRFSRGVKQKDLHVLRLNAMPSVLIEIGFINNPIESHYIASEAGQAEVSKNIYDAIIKYKSYLDRNKKKDPEPKKPVEQPLKNNFKVLMVSSPIKYLPTDPALKGLNDILVIKENDVYKYYYGSTYYASIRDQNLKTVKNAGYPNAYVVSFTPNQVMNSGYYTIELAVSKDKLPSDSFILKNYPATEREKINGIFFYTYGKVDTLEKAIELQKSFADKGIKNTAIQKVIKR